MFVYQNDKLYAEHDNKLVGVSITPTGTSYHNDYSTKFSEGQVLTTFEVYCKFGIFEGGSYKFPIDKKVGEKIENTTGNDEDVVKPTRRKSK